MLSFVKGNVLGGLELVRRTIPGFNLHSALTGETERVIQSLPSPDQRRLLKGTLLTRDLAAEGETLFVNHGFDHIRFGQLLSAQHRVLRDHLQTSTPKIERMIQAALAAGALGAKINGSGGGSTMFAYAPQDPERVARAVEAEGGRVDIVRTDDGIRRES
jgi:galactokinase